jgi:hypothetical protein
MRAEYLQALPAGGLDRVIFLLGGNDGEPRRPGGLDGAGAAASADP